MLCNLLPHSRYPKPAASPQPLTKMATPVCTQALLPNNSMAPDVPSNLTIRTLLLSPVSLNASLHLPALFKLINHCFNVSHNSKGRSLLPSSPTSRLKTHNQLSEEIGPDAFTIIMLAQDTSTQVRGEEIGKREGDGDTVIATASAKPYVPPEPYNNEAGIGETSEKLFKRQPGGDKAFAAYAELPKWEILCMCVEPTLQGRGIAGQLMGLTVEEIKRRVVEGTGEAQESKMGQKNVYGEDRNGTKEKAKGEVLLMLSSMQELNESYYAKRGWQTTGVRRFPPGTLGSRDGFGVVEMMKVVSL